MGIPKFFRWFSERYPLINQLNLQDTYHMAPEYDYLYLDMNGIIHNCTHGNIPSVLMSSVAEEEMFVKVFQYIDKLVLYMAIDGVAPRAKLNQQRQRRFKSSYEAAEAKAQAEAKGEVVNDNPFDSNCITPGTHFMGRLSDHIEYWVRKKIKEDSAWKKMKIIFSGASVPGEGEHKIMEFIRHMQAQPDWQPNQSHVMYGLDADLIMLALVSHEPHFSVLREEVLTSRTRKKNTLGVEDTLFQLLHVSLVREYLDLEFGDLKEQVPNYDLERIVDDFILMCFFVGNDFLPSLPCFDIGEGSLNQVFQVYKGLLPRLGGYLCEGVNVNFERLGQFLAGLTDREKNFYGEVSTAGFFPPDPDDPEAVDNTDFDPDEDDAWKDFYYRDRFGVSLSDEDFHLDLVMSYLEGLSWNLHYYHNGVVSWGWYYPYYYAPLASDLQDAFQYAAPSGDFSYGKPFLPFQQLMAVLPAASARLLPSIYRQLMLNPTSPIHDYYPKNFQIDMTGKKFSWEGIAKIPFIEEARLLSAMAEVEAREYGNLTIEERMRNRHGTPRVFFYDEQSQESVPSPSPHLGGFPVLTDSLSRAENFSLPPFPDPARCSFKRPAGSQDRLQGRPGFPTLSTIPFTLEFEKGQVNVFGNLARFESMLLCPTEAAVDVDADTIEDVGAGLAGKRAYVGWPYFKEARVSAVLSKTHRFENGKCEANTDSEQRMFNKEMAFLSSQYLASHGIRLDRIHYLVQVQELQGMQYLPNGARKKVFKMEKTLYPLQLVLRRIPRQLYDTRFLEQGPLALPQLLPVRSLVLVTHKNYYGCPAVVLGHKEDAGQVVVKLEVLPPETTLGHKIAERFQEQYKPLRDVAQELGIAFKVLAKLTGSVFVGARRSNVGLNLKFSKRQQQILGYSRKIMSDFGVESWEFSERAIMLIDSFCVAFPLVVRMINDQPDVEVYDEELLVPPEELALARAESYSDEDYAFALAEHKKAKIKAAVIAIRDWLADQDFAGLPLVPVGSGEIPTAGLALLTEGIDKRTAERQNAEHNFKTVKIDPKYLRLPVSDDPTTVEQERSGSRAEVRLGDRVVTLQSNGPVPFGSRGTVIAAVGPKCFVLLDRASTGATDLSGRVPAMRGVVLRLSYLLNLSATLEPKRPRSLSSGARQAPVQPQILQPQAQAQAQAQPPAQQPTQSSVPALAAPATAAVAAPGPQYTQPVDMGALFNAARTQQQQPPPAAAQGTPVSLGALFGAARAQQDSSQAAAAPGQPVSVGALFEAVRLPVPAPDTTAPGQPLSLDALFGAARAQGPAAAAAAAPRPAASEAQPVPQPVNLGALFAAARQPEAPPPSAQQPLQSFASSPPAAPAPVAVAASPAKSGLSALLDDLDDPPPAAASYRFGQQSPAKQPWYENK